MRERWYLHFRCLNFGMMLSFTEAGTFPYKYIHISLLLSEKYLKLVKYMSYNIHAIQCVTLNKARHRQIAIAAIA